MRVAWNELAIPGVFMSTEGVFGDQRGSFHKIIGESETPGPCPFNLAELYWSRSARGTVRGFHFQLPPHAVRKVVFVTHGSIRDFMLDLRVGSPTEQQILEVRMTPQSGGLVVPGGIAHAFEVLEENSIVCYAQDAVFEESSYAGIRLESTGITLETATPIMSERDQRFPTLSEFISPFQFNA